VTSAVGLGLRLIVTEESTPPPRRKRKQRCDRFELLAGDDRAPPSARPEVHRLVEEYDTRGLRTHLKAHPSDVNLRNKDGDAPIHVIAAKGAVMVAEALDEFGPDHLASDGRGLLPGHIAAEKHPKTAEFLFERALASGAREPAWKTIEEVEKAASEKNLDRAAADLCGVQVADLNAPMEVVKNRTHLEAVKGAVLELKSEGWWQDKFVPQRVRALLRATREAPEKMRPALIREIAVQLDLLRTIRRVLATKKCSKEHIRQMAMKLEAQQIFSRLDRARPGREQALALGWNGHAIYCGMVIVPAKVDVGHPQDTLLFRIDNLGSGVAMGHEKDEDLVHSRALHIPLTHLRTPEGASAFQSFLADLLTVKATPDSDGDDFYSRVARYKSELKAVTGCTDLVESEYSARDKSLPKQIAGNCVVANTFPGLAARLGAETFEWFTSFEGRLARTLVETHADTNKLIDEACKERDQREIAKVIEAAGPWAAKLNAIIEGGRATYDVAALCKTITVDHMKKIIEGGDAEALRIVLGHGARVFVQDASDRTPLHWAAKLGNVEMVEALLAKGASVNAMDADGNTPLHDALSAGCHAVVALLLSKDADADRENRKGVTPRAAIDQQVQQTLLIAKTLRTTPRPRTRTLI
jgi:hypothetical protein